jgi:hypothetical protein
VAYDELISNDTEKMLKVMHERRGLWLLGERERKDTAGQACDVMKKASVHHAQTGTEAEKETERERERERERGSQTDKEIDTLAARFHIHPSSLTAGRSNRSIPKH